MSSDPDSSAEKKNIYNELDKNNAKKIAESLISLVGDINKSREQYTQQEQGKKITSLEEQLQANEQKNKLTMIIDTITNINRVYLENQLTYAKNLNSSHQEEIQKELNKTKIKKIISTINSLIGINKIAVLNKTIEEQTTNQTTITEENAKLTDQLDISKKELHKTKLNAIIGTINNLSELNGKNQEDMDNIEAKQQKMTILSNIVYEISSISTIKLESDVKNFKTENETLTQSLGQSSLEILEKDKLIKKNNIQNIVNTINGLNDKKKEEDNKNELNTKYNTISKILHTTNLTNIIKIINDVGKIKQQEEDSNKIQQEASNKIQQEAVKQKEEIKKNKLTLIVREIQHVGSLMATRNSNEVEKKKLEESFNTEKIKLQEGLQKGLQSNLGKIVNIISGLPRKREREINDIKTKEQRGKLDNITKNIQGLQILHLEGEKTKITNEIQGLNKNAQITKIINVIQSLETFHLKGHPQNIKDVLINNEDTNKILKIAKIVDTINHLSESNTMITDAIERYKEYNTTTAKFYRKLGKMGTMGTMPKQVYNYLFTSKPVIKINHKKLKEYLHQNTKNIWEGVVINDKLEYIGMIDNQYEGKTETTNTYMFVQPDIWNDKINETTQYEKYIITSDKRFLHKEEEEEKKEEKKEEEKKEEEKEKEEEEKEDS